MFLQFRADKRIEIVPVEIRFRRLREVFLVVGRRVVLHEATVEKQDLVIQLFLRRGLYTFLRRGNPYPERPEL